MKLILSIIQDSDYDNVSTSLISEGFRVTCVASYGGFLRKGNKTLLIGLDEDKVEKALNLIRINCSDLVEPNTQRATVFVLNVADHINF